MKAYSILIAASVLAFMSCNNSGTDKEANKDSSTMKSGDTTTTMMHDTAMHHEMTAGVPAEPAAPKGAKVFFVNLKNGATVTSPLTIHMGASGIKVDTAGPVVAGSGHHHLLIDGPDSLAFGSMVPKDSLNLHFGKGQTDAEIKLSPGKHKLTLQFADGLHRSYGKQLSNSITVMVKQ